ncbi:DUF4038 domain-containing protein [Haloferula sp.]|uniref:apiosidase-like domain-containing protein n=1 Tax=Haloferula sp. TaxID=2497595 RepID=UPI00329DDD83
MMRIVIWLMMGMALSVKAAPAVDDVAVLHEMEVNEVILQAQKTYKNAYLEVDLWVDLKGPNGLSYRIPAFWDGGQTFRARLVATRPGDWSWSTGTGTGDSGLDGKSGTFRAIAWTEAEKEKNPNRRGFIRVAANKHTLEYADGTPFFYTADTWWCALTRVYAWDSDDCVAGISFQDAIALRKAQGFNSINCIAAFPGDTLNGLWAPVSNGEKVSEDGSTPFVITEPNDKQFGVDYSQINPSYWKQVDRKFHHFWEQGFVPYVETLRRHEEWYAENEMERKAFVNYNRYLWARYGCYNLIYSWIHCEGVENKHMHHWRPMVRMAYEKLGRMPYGQPRTHMAWGSTMESWAVDGPAPLPVGEALPIGAYDMHTIGNRHRDFNNHGELRRIFNGIPTMPGANIEAFYPGWPVNKAAKGLNLNTMPQFQMYGCVLNGGFAGHAWGDNYYSGALKEGGEPHAKGFDRWTAKSMGHLKSFILDEGHDYRLLVPATKTNLAVTKQEWRVLALARDQSVGLGFIAANHAKTDLIKLHPKAEYQFQWYNIDTGSWSKASALHADGTGKLVLPEKPNAKGWAFRIKAVDGRETE